MQVQVLDRVARMAARHAAPTQAETMSSCAVLCLLQDTDMLSARTSSSHEASHKHVDEAAFVRVFEIGEKELAEHAKQHEERSMRSSTSAAMGVIRAKRTWMCCLRDAAAEHGHTATLEIELVDGHGLAAPLTLSTN